VGGDPSGRVRETITKEMAAAEAAVPNKVCEFILQIPGMLLKRIKIKINV
jgi:hypothetical protein